MLIGLHQDVDVLCVFEQNKDSTGELIRKIEEAVSGTLNNSRSSRIASRLRSITGLKYHIQTHLDQLEASRQTLLDRILEIDQTMANPKEEDIERVRHCRICQAIDDGPTCVHCELEGIISETLRANCSTRVDVVSGSSSRDFVQESLWQNLYKWSPYDMDISRMRDGMRMRFLEGKRLLTILFKEEISVQHRHWNGRLQNIASCNEGYCDVFLYKTEKEEILTIQFFEQK
ncbi:hypothetical protein D5086_033398 [Populus alba]|uniref:Uncharacterized protein n=1 Tax=Populus alba TaxID=43335 RepID=A0ACC4AGP1_POPAL